MRSHIFLLQTFVPLAIIDHQSEIILVLMTTCNQCLNFGEKCSSIMILYMFRNNPTKGQTGSGIYTSDGVTFKKYISHNFSFLNSKWPWQIPKINGMVKSDNENNPMHHFAQHVVLAQHVWPGAHLLPQPHLQLHQTTHCQSACGTCQVHPSKHLTCHFLKKKSGSRDAEAHRKLLDLKGAMRKILTDQIVCLQDMEDICMFIIIHMAQEILPQTLIS